MKNLRSRKIKKDGNQTLKYEARKRQILNAHFPSSKLTLKVLDAKTYCLSASSRHFVKKIWTPHSRGLNLMDYSKWSSLAHKKVNIQIVEHLCEHLRQSKFTRFEINMSAFGFRRRLKACQEKRFENELKLRKRWLIWRLHSFSWRAVVLLCLR